MAKICQLHADLNTTCACSQLSCVTERLGHVEHDLDLERASREDIIKAEVERRLKEMERALEAKIQGLPNTYILFVCQYFYPETFRDVTSE